MLDAGPDDIGGLEKAFRAALHVGIVFREVASLATSVCFGCEAWRVGLDVSQTDLSCFLSQWA